MTNKKKLILLIVWTVISMSVYLMLCVPYDVGILMAYIIVASILIVAFTILNRGFEKQPKSDDPKEQKRQNLATTCALIALPLIFSVLLDVMLSSFGYSLPQIVFNLLYS
jgi:hypothetical protein